MQGLRSPAKGINSHASVWAASSHAKESGHRGRAGAGEGAIWQAPQEVRMNQETRETRKGAQ